MTCLVCGSRISEPHFGGISCRACAAFFRRFFNSKKERIMCICKSKSPNSHPCRSCRVAKCIAIGMTPERIHGSRDPNGTHKKYQNYFNFQPSTSFLLTPSITPKTTSNISSTLPLFSEYERRRCQIFGKPELQDLFIVTSLTKLDIDITTQFICEVYPEFQSLAGIDQKSLVQNFLIKLWNMEPILDHVAKRVEHKKKADEDIQKMMFPLFEGSFSKGAEMSKEELWRTFGTFWTQFYEKLVDPICDLNLDQTELMALLWILFFDQAFINISESSSEFCWTIRKVILKELRNYESEKYPDDPESRFLEILEIPMIVERGEKQFHNEIIVCELVKLRMHDDFKTMMRRQRI